MAVAGSMGVAAFVVAVDSTEEADFEVVVSVAGASTAAEVLAEVEGIGKGQEERRGAMAGLKDPAIFC